VSNVDLLIGHTIRLDLKVQALCNQISLCNLCVLCISVVNELFENITTEDTEVAQRRSWKRLK